MRKPSTVGAVTGAALSLLLATALPGASAADATPERTPAPTMGPEAGSGPGEAAAQAQRIQQALLQIQTETLQADAAEPEVRAEQEAFQRALLVAMQEHDPRTRDLLAAFQQLQSRLGSD